MFITFEGIEGCGKTTQIKRLAAKLRKAGIPLIMTFEPGDTRIGKHIRRILLDARNHDLCPLAELMLYISDRAQHIQEKIKPALDRGQWVLCDRLHDATLAYQGGARGQDQDLIRLLNAKALNGMQPALTFLLDCPIQIGLRRARKRDQASSQKGQDRFEREKKIFHEKVRQAYLDLAQQEPERFVIIDATRSRDEMAQAIFERLRHLVKPSA